MEHVAKQVASQTELQSKIVKMFSRRIDGARERYVTRLQQTFDEHPVATSNSPEKYFALGVGMGDYMIDVAQRAIIFWDTLRERGNQWIEHQKAGLPPVLHFDYEMILDAREFKPPVNYALLRIIPPAGVNVDSKRRPYLVIDPRAGHGPGIGGFKDDSEIGVALRDGHPVYFVTFFPDPEKGQTLLDVCAAETVFVKKVRELHPDSAKPVIVGNCQGGWAAMMLAASDPDDTGPIVINGAPMSYWGGAWEEGENDNPMRYSGGLLGGSWISSFVSDLSNGIFDGAWLVQNFENLNPANTFWSKYYHVFANADTEPPRFLEFERWWGGFYLMNREEIEWITQNLFVGNKLWSGGIKTKSGRFLDLREIRSPIVLFASMGDNITPPEQAFNWVADVYGSTEEIKARGQVIVGLLHNSVGHLGIFVSGSVANKEHAQIVSVMKSIEALPPGLYGMTINTVIGDAGVEEYEVEFVEKRLEEVAVKLNKFQRKDEKPFEVVAEVSEFNQHAYELFAQPFVQAMANDFTRKLAYDFHPMRSQRWSWSDINPWLGWLAPAAAAVKTQRKMMAKLHPWRQLETMGSDFIVASLDYYRDISNAISEAVFFQVYGSLFSIRLADGMHRDEREQVQDPRSLPVVQAALARIASGGFAEAAARISFLLHHSGEPLPLSQLELRAELVQEYKDLLPAISIDQLRRIRGEQEIIARFEPEKAITTLPQLLSNSVERERLLRLFTTVLADPRIDTDNRTPEQRVAFERVSAVLGIQLPKVPQASVRMSKRGRDARPAAKAAAPVVAKASPQKTPAKKTATTKPVASKPIAKSTPKPAAKSAVKPVAKSVVSSSKATKPTKAS